MRWGSLPSQAVGAATRDETSAHNMGPALAEPANAIAAKTATALFIQFSKMDLMINQAKVVPESSTR
jgi:hypothetical protein